jgi:hypothetical protein
MAIDEIANPEGQLRRVAGGSSTGTSTGAPIIGTEDPLAGLNAAMPGSDLGGGGGSVSVPDNFEGQLPGPDRTSTGNGTGADRSIALSVMLVVLGAFAVLLGGS